PAKRAPPPPAHGGIRSVSPHPSARKRRKPALVPHTHAAATPTADRPNRQRTPPARAPAGRSASWQSGDVSGASAGHSPGWIPNPAPTRAHGATRRSAATARIAISHRRSGRDVILAPPSKPDSISRTAGHVIRKPSPAPEGLRVGPRQSYANDWRKAALLTASSSDACALSDETATSRTAGIARKFLILHHIPTPSPATSQPNFRAGVIVRFRYSTGP